MQLALNSGQSGKKLRDLRKPIRSLPAVWSQHIVVRLAEHVIELVESKMFGEQLVGEAVHSGQAVQFHYSCYVASLKPGNMSMAMLIRLVQREEYCMKP